MTAARQERYYQQAAIEAVISDYDAGYRSLLLALATGAGKTHTSVKLAREFCRRKGIANPRIVFVAPRVELVDQTILEIGETWPEVTAGRIQSANSQFGRNWSVAVVNSAYSPKRLKRLQAQTTHVLVIDEAHHSPSKMNREVIDTLANPDTLILGLTATPNRSDGVALSEIFERISYTYLLPDALTDGFLVDLHGISVRLPIDLDALPTGDDGDFKKPSLRDAMMQPAVVNATVQAWLEHAKGLKTVAFGVEVEHAKALAAAFRAAGVTADFVHGGMGDEERRERYRALKQGSIQVLCNVAVLTEGFDERSIRCVLLARPTTSQGLYTQIVGRGARLDPYAPAHDPKTECIVLDVTGTSERISLQSLPMLGGLPIDEPEAREQAEKDGTVREQGQVREVPSLRAVASTATKVNLLRKPTGQRYQWGQTQWGPALSIGRAGIFMVVEDRERAGRVRVVHAQELPGVPSLAPEGTNAHRIEILATGLWPGEAIGFCEAEARRFGAKPRAGGESIAPADPERVRSVILDALHRHKALEAQAGHDLPKGAAAGAGPALLRRLREKMPEPQARALTQYEAVRVLHGEPVPDRVKGAA